MKKALRRIFKLILEFRAHLFVLTLFLHFRFSYSQCFDLGTNCEQLKHLCRYPAYAQFLEDHCPRACGFCTDSGKACIDNRKECEYWSLNGFCGSQFFSVSERQRYCAKTCQLCNL